MHAAPIYVSSTGPALLLDFMQQRGLLMPDLQARLIVLCESPRVPIGVWYELLSTLEQLTGSPAVGLEIAALVQRRHVGTLGHLTVHSDTFLQALNRYCRFQSLLHNVIEFSLIAEGQQLVMRWFGHEQNPAPLLSDELFLGGIVTLIRNHAGHPGVRPVGVSFPQPRPSFAHEHERFFQCPVQFDAGGLSLTWPLSMLNQLNQHPDAALVNQLEHHAQRMMSDLQAKDPLLHQIRHHILRSLHDGEPDFATVAQRMGVAERTLYRQLQERGIRFKAVLGQIRFDMARQYLGDQALSLMEITLLLGYSEQSTFTRAFRAWSGMTPQQFRRGVVGLPRP